MTVPSRSNVHPLDAGVTEIDTGSITIEIDRTWRSGPGAHGGLIAALAAIAAQAAAPEFQLQSMSTQLLRPVRQPLTVTAVVERHGLRTAAVSVRGVANRRLVALATATLGRRADGPQLTLPAPIAPSPGACAELLLPLDLVPFAQHLEMRRVGDNQPFGRHADAEFTAWIRWREPRRIDAAAIAVFLDALPPALYAVTAEVVAIPTVDFFVQWVGRSEVQAGAWALVRITTIAARDGWSLDESSVWTAGGELLGTARQTRAISGWPRADAAGPVTVE